MDNAIKPIAATTSLSLLIHGVAIAGLLLVYGQSATRDEGVGQGVEVQLISSTTVADQQQADVPAKQEKPVEETASESLIHTAQKRFAETVLTAQHSSQSVSNKRTVEEKLIDENRDEQLSNSSQRLLAADYSESLTDTAQATNASRQQHAILELLHRSISDKKEYPYLARRQRREGVATVAFVLHPDGKIENARLVSSSRAMVLDRAALSAVRHIEPFIVARDYLDQSEEFQVDIEFELL